MRKLFFFSFINCVQIFRSPRTSKHTSSIRRTSIILLWLGLACHNESQAQKIPPFGNIDKEEFGVKECSYDKEANAEYLIDMAEVRYYAGTNNFLNKTTQRIRIKILNEKALDLANIRLAFYSKNKREYIRDIEGYTYNLNDSGELEETKLEKGSIISQRLDENVEMMVFSMPKVKAGSIIEYRYEHTRFDYFEIADWIFQRPFPVRYSEYNVEIPTNFYFVYHIRNTLPVEETTEAGIRRFVMKEIPGLYGEPFMSSSKDYLQRIDFQHRSFNRHSLQTSWEKLVLLMLKDESFGQQLKKNVYRTTSLPAELKKLSNPIDQLNTIVNYVKREVAWNGKTSMWAQEGIKNALQKHFGNSADMNLLLINLLRNAGFKAHPVLVSTRSNGKVNNDYPFLHQFNDIYVYTEANGNPHIIDVTNFTNPVTQVPWDVQFTEGLLVDETIAQFIKLNDIKHRFKLITSVLADINIDGKITGSASILAYEYAKDERLQSLRQSEKKYLLDYFSTPHPDFKFDSLKYKNNQIDSLPLENVIQFSGTLNSSGDYMFYSPNFLMELEKNEFISEKRFTDIEFGYLQQYNMSTTLRFPQEFEPEGLPENIRMILPDTSISLQRFIDRNETSISIRYILEIKRPTYYAEEYPDFKAFYARLFEKLNEQIVFKRKTRPKP